MALIGDKAVVCCIVQSRDTKEAKPNPILDRSCSFRPDMLALH